MVRDGNANRKSFTSIFLDGPVMDGHIPVKLAISVFAVPRKSTRIRPFERFDTQNSAVIMIMFHIIGHEHVPGVHDEGFIVIALRPLLVVARKNKERVVMHEGCGIRRIKVRRQWICGKSRLRPKSPKYAKKAKNGPFQHRKKSRTPNSHKHLQIHTKQRSKYILKIIKSPHIYL